MKILITLFCLFLFAGCSGGMQSSSDGLPSGAGIDDPADSCVLPASLGGGTLIHQGSITAFQNSTVPNGQTCVSESRICDDGTLSGTYLNLSCTVQGSTTNPCTLDGVTVAHGVARNFFNTNAVSCGQTCQSQSRTCNNGTFSGDNSYNRASCSAASCNACTLDGVTVAHGASRTFYDSTTVACGQTCNGLSRTCNNGALSGATTYNRASCSVNACNASCPLPWGGTIPHGDSRTAYQSASVPAGQTCVDQTRTCNNGTLSGSYTNASCVVDTQPPVGNGLVIDLSYVNTSSSKYTRFKTYVDNKVNGGNPYGFAGIDAAYMYSINGGSQYCTLAVNFAEQQVAAAEAAIAGGGRPEIAGDSYLEVGPFLADVAIAYDWCRSFLTAAQRTRWTNYANQAIYNVWNPNQATWGGRAYPWSGWSIDNPGNNYFYSFTEATMYWALASNNATMKTLARSKMNMLNTYFSALPGGGSLEGTGYGTAHMRLFGLYHVWRDSTGEDYANMNAHLTDSIKYWVHATLPNRSRFAPIGDQARVSEPELFDYHRRLVLEARHMTNSTGNKDLASWWLNHISVNQMAQGFNFRHDLMDAGTNTATAPTEGLVYRASGVGQLFARSGWDTSALWMQFTAGTYNESHAGQTQGSFTLANSTWLAATENIWSHSGINQATDVMNLVRFVRNGSSIIQREGTNSPLVINSQNANGSVNATANLTPSFAGNSAVTNWTRNIDFATASRRLTVTDNFATSADTQAIFQVNVPVQPTVSGNLITAGTLKIRVITPATPTITITNWNSVDSSEYNSGYRVNITGAAGQFVVELTDQ